MTADQSAGNDPSPAEAGFRTRGGHATRLETFVDAAFAFSLTLLLIFQGELPQTVAELREAMLRVPTFVMSFSILALFWAAHRRWSLRFGLQDARSTLLSLAFVLVLLVYVYPLRMVVSAFMSLVSGGLLPSELGFDRADGVLDAQTAFMIYSAGFGLLALVVVLLNRHALARSAQLDLQPHEVAHTRSEIGSHLILGGVALLSLATSVVVLLSGTGNAFLVGLPMWFYASLSVLMPLYWSRQGKATGGGGRNAA